jgi:tetraacyldisaccharide 4'-kinase
MEQRLTAHWYHESPVASPLAPLSWLYGAVVRARRSAYARGWLRTFRAGRPLLVVGNLTVGGTGKTPLVIWLAEQLTARGLKVGIVSRGHGSGSGEGVRLVRPGSSWQEVGDEPLVLAARTGCATVVARDRVAGARSLVALGAEVILADDGLQHLRLARDCEIIVIDGARGFGNGRVLPAGPLREPVGRLPSADAIVVNGPLEHASLKGPALLERPLFMRLAPAAALPVDGRATARPLESFRGEPVHAVAGIGHPARFFRELHGHGLTVIEHPFPDHHPFTAADLSFADALPVLMTEKDAVKCRSFASSRLWYLPVAAMFSEADTRQLMTRVSLKLGL